MRFKITMIVFGVCLPAVFGLLGWRLYYLQFCRSDYYTQTSQTQQLSTIPLSAQRGYIADSQGRVLAASNMVDVLFAEPRRFKDAEQVKETAWKLQDLIHIPGPEICRLIYETNNPGYVRLQTGLSTADRKAIMEQRLVGVGVQSQWQRYYPIGQLMSHVVGFVGAEGAGLAGLELKYDGILQGNPGKSVFLVDVQRRPIAFEPDRSRDATAGQSLVLTIDSTIQEFVRSALLKQVKEYNAESALGVMMDPKTGAILALVSLPDYDPTLFNTASASSLRNRALTDPYEPGSVIKPIVAAIALDYGAISYNQVFYCEDGYWGKYRIGEFGNHRYGNFTVKDIIVHSSNVGMAKIGLQLGNKRLYEGMRRFGFGEKTLIDLPGEDPGLLRPVSAWSGYSVTRIPFGHEILVTSIQLIRAYSILANGGSLIVPHVVRAVVSADGSVTELYQSAQGTGYVIKPEVAKWMVEKAMVGVVNEGTGDKAQMEGVQVWGKTGTANIALPSGGYDTSNYVASFVGGAPADSPKVVVMVSIRKLDRSLGKGYSGGRVASPVVKEILEKTLPYLER